MTTISSKSRDWDAMLNGVHAWLNDRWQTKAPVSVSMAEAPRTNGFSSESAMLRVSWRDAGDQRSRGIVLRVPPAGDGVFPEYDLVRQARVMELARSRGIPVPEILGVETDESYLGATFVVMDLVPGRIPADEAPQYCVAGWLFDATPERQRVMYDNFHDILADINRITAADGDLAFLQRPQGPGLVGELDWWSRYLAWATDGAPSTEMAEVLDWLRRNVPDPEPPASLIWGDARFGNVIFDDVFGVRAVLDWEMATVGPAEIDLGWSFAVRRSIQHGNGLPLDQELPGFAGRAATIERYGKRLGRSVRTLEWYEVFAMLRMGAVLEALAGLLLKAGITDHIIHAIPPLQDWVYDLMETAS